MPNFSMSINPVFPLGSFSVLSGSAKRSTDESRYSPLADLAGGDHAGGRRHGAGANGSFASDRSECCSVFDPAVLGERQF